MDRGRRARSGKINNSLEIESCADKNCFFSILRIFVRFLIKFWAVMGKRRKSEIGIIV